MKSTTNVDFPIIGRLELLKGSKTQREFAEWLDQPVATVGSYFTGTRRPGIDFFESLARKGVNLNWFLTGDGPVYLKGDNRIGQYPPEAQIFLMELIQDGIKPENLPEIMKRLKELRDLQKNVDASKEGLRLSLRVLKESFKGRKK